MHLFTERLRVLLERIFCFHSKSGDWWWTLDPDEIQVEEMLQEETSVLSPAMLQDAAGRRACRTSSEFVVVGCTVLSGAGALEISNLTCMRIERSGSDSPALKCCFRAVSSSSLA